MKKMKKIKLGLGARVVFVLLVIILSSAWFLAKKSYDLTLEHKNEDVKEELQTLNNLHTELLKANFRTARAIVNQVSTNPHLLSLLRSPYSRVQYQRTKDVLNLENINQIFSSLYLMDKDGEVLVATNPKFEGHNYGFREYFQKGLAGETDFYVAVGVTTHKLGFYFSSPVKDKQGKVVGVLVGKVVSCKHDYNDESGSERKHSLLVTQEGLVLSSDKPEWQFTALVPVKPELKQKWIEERKFPQDIKWQDLGFSGLMAGLENKVTGGIFKDDRGNQWYYASRKLADCGFYDVVLVPGELIVAPAKEQAKVMWQAMLMVLILGSLAFSFQVWRNVRLLNKMSKFAVKIAHGQFPNDLRAKTIVQDQFTDLMEALNLMKNKLARWHQDLNKEVKKKTRELEEKVKELEEAKLDLEKFKLAVDNVGEQIVITDPDGIVLYANTALKKITGFKPEEVVGKKVGTGELWGGLMGKRFYQQFWHQIKTKKKMFTGELTNKRKNGQKYIAAASIAPVLNRKGEVVYFVGVERDVTREREIDRMKTDFISLASHQLRTPLSAIRWFLEMLLNGDLGRLTKKQKEVIEDIEKSNDRMIELVNSLLNISRIESGRIIVEPELVDLKELVSGVVEELEEYIQKKKQTVIVSIHHQLPKIKLDPKLVRQVYLNLISNAVKYTPEGGEINVFVSKKDKQVISQISDTGYGIPKEEQHRIFERFFRASNVVKQEVGGTGLGLYLAKAIVESSGGKIWFKSEVGKGTTFWFTLPMKGMKPKKGEVRLT